MEYGIPAQLIISQQSKDLESFKWYQMIAITMFYNHVIRYINQRTNGPVNAHLSLLHIPINMFEYYGI